MANPSSRTSFTTNGFQSVNNLLAQFFYQAKNARNNTDIFEKVSNIANNILRISGRNLLLPKLEFTLGTALFHYFFDVLDVPGHYLTPYTADRIDLNATYEKLKNLGINAKITFKNKNDEEQTFEFNDEGVSDIISSKAQAKLVKAALEKTVKDMANTNTAFGSQEDLEKKLMKKFLIELLNSGLLSRLKEHPYQNLPALTTNDSEFKLTNICYGLNSDGELELDVTAKEQSEIDPMVDFPTQKYEDKRTADQLDLFAIKNRSSFDFTTMVTWDVVTLASVSWNLEHVFNLVSHANLAASFGRIPGMQWVNNQNLMTNITRLVCVGYVMKLVKTAQLLNQKELTPAEKNNQLRHAVYYVAELAFNGMSLMNLAKGQNVINQKIIWYSAVAAKVIGLGCIFMKPATEYKVDIKANAAF